MKGVSCARRTFDVDLIATSADWDAEKPDPAFFTALTRAAARPAGQIAYVGDRVDNDIRPATEAGLKTVFIQRGPWGHHYATQPDPIPADLTITSLNELVTTLTTHPAR